MSPLIILVKIDSFILSLYARVGVRYTRIMKPSLLTIRAIGSEFANRLWLPIIIIAAIISIVLIGLVWWLSVSVSGWWILLAIPVSVLLSVAFVVLTVFKLVIRYVAPPQNKQQKQQVVEFVDKLQSVSDAVQTPKIVLLFYVVRDIAAPRENGFVATLTTNSSTLKGDFTKLKRSFTEI